MKKIVKFLFLIFWAILNFVVVWLAILTIGGNFHKVSEGIYRSGQLYQFNFEKFYEKYHFKTILNLRGRKEDKNWYQYEIKFCKQHKIKHIDFKMNDKEVQSLQTMNKLLKIIENAKKPLLIHCKSGADRSGLASAIYLYSLGDKNNDQLSLKYGHIPLSISPTSAMDKSYKKWREWRDLQKKIEH